MKAKKDDTQTNWDKLKTSVLIAARHLLAVYEEDITSGIRDGIYEKKDNKKVLADIEKAHKLFDKFNSYTPEVLVYVEGGNIQGASATESIKFTLFDKDNFDYLDYESSKQFIESFGTPPQWDEIIETRTKKKDIKPIF